MQGLVSVGGKLWLSGCGALGYASRSPAAASRWAHRGAAPVSSSPPACLQVCLNITKPVMVTQIDVQARAGGRTGAAGWPPARHELPALPCMQQSSRLLPCHGDHMQLTGTETTYWTETRDHGAGSHHYTTTGKGR